MAGEVAVAVGGEPDEAGRAGAAFQHDVDARGPRRPDAEVDAGGEEEVGAGGEAAADPAMR